MVQVIVVSPAPSQAPLRLAVLIASYNRVGVTMRGLSSLRDCVLRDGRIQADYYLLDDRSPDLTGTLVKAAFPDIHVLEGTGDLFWNRGMSAAYRCARKNGGYQAYLLFNDDVVLIPEGFGQLVSAFLDANGTGEAVITGALISPTSGRITYGGVLNGPPPRLLNFRQMAPDGSLQACDTFQGNCVLVPAPLMDRLQGLDSRYRHAYGDIDLGMAVRRTGARIYLSAIPVGYCERDAPWRVDLRMLTLRERFRRLFVAPDPVSDFVLYAFKNRPIWHALPVSAYHVARRFWCVFFPR